MHKQVALCLTFGLLIGIIGVRGQTDVCSKTFTENTGTLESLNFPYTIKTPNKCEWKFNITNGTSGLVYLNVETIDLNENDVLTVFDGFKATNYTDKDLQHAFFILSASNGSLTVDFKQNNNSTSITVQRFKAEFVAKPVGQNEDYYNDEYVGLIRSPIYSEQNDVAQFSWIITQKPDKNIYITFKSLNVSNGSLVIDDGKIQKNFTGFDLPSDTTFSSSNVKITLNLNLDQLQHFVLFYSYLYGNCSEDVTIINETEVAIEFNGIPSEYPVNCFRVIEGPNNTVLSAFIDWYSFNNSENPSNVIITLADGGSRFSRPLLVDAPVNGNKAVNVITSSNKLWIGYSYTSSAKGEFSTVNLTVQNHGGSYYQSGKFGVNETSNVTLSSSSSSYILNVPSNEQIITTLAENTILKGSNRILFYDGGNKEHLITEFSNESTYFYPVVSKNNKMLIVAEHFINNDTFEASFIGTSQDYDQLTVLNYGTFEVNGMAANSTHNWIIAPNYNESSAELIALTITKADLSSSLTLSIYDGPTNSSKLLFKLSNVTINLATIYISSNKGASLTFENYGNTFTGIVADLSFELLPKCNATLDLNTTKFNVISSPAYPNLYPSNAECEWHITSPKYILLSFKTLDLPITQPLLIFGNESKLLFNISGSGPIDDIIIAESHIVLNWSSMAPLNNLTSSKGFEIEVQRLDCGEALNESVKKFSTPGYPSDLKNSALCAWSISIPSMSSQVEVIKLVYDSIPVKSTSAKMTIYEGGSLASPIANFSEASETNFLSRTNKLFITYNYTLDASGGTPYTFNYDAFACKDTCKNGLCLHESWRCNGQNDCGDYSDEIDCAQSKIVEISTGVSVTALVVSILFCLTLGAVGTFALPIVWRKLRSHGRNYQEFRNSVDA